ncbi:CbtA family protein [Natronomonas gomsonensis]|uniref:CbtA family protein n=1 Tax=Natronomonas gomsonensis TaxID=1046043 RepID=UPI0015BA6FCB|nr:CbtA family protein [Natronomonas gomsonensis]
MYDALRRGAIAGAVGGGAYGLYVALVGNPLVEHAEELAHHGHGHGHEATVVADGVTSVVSVGGSAALGLLFGLVVFGFVGYLLEPALPDRGGSYLLGLGGFLTVSGVPWLVLPPAAPGVETTVATDFALSLYVGLMAVGAVACLASGWVYHRLAEYGRPVGTAAALAVFVTTVGVAAFAAPSPGYESTLPATFEAAYVGSVVVGQLGLWGIAAATHSRLDTALRPDAHGVAPTAAD